MQEKARSSTHEHSPESHGSRSRDTNTSSDNRDKGPSVRVSGIILSLSLLAAEALVVVLVVILLAVLLPTRQARIQSSK